MKNPPWNFSLFHSPPPINMSSIGRQAVLSIMHFSFVDKKRHLVFCLSVTYPILSTEKYVWIRAVKFFLAKKEIHMLSFINLIVFSWAVRNKLTKLQIIFNFWFSLTIDSTQTFSISLRFMPNLFQVLILNKKGREQVNPNSLVLFSGTLFRGSN